MKAGREIFCSILSSLESRKISIDKRHVVLRELTRQFMELFHAEKGRSLKRETEKGDGWCCIPRSPGFSPGTPERQGSRDTSQQT